MKTCSACGGQNPDEARFCRSCGSPLADAAAPAAAPLSAPTPADDDPEATVLASSAHLSAAPAPASPAPAPAPAAPVTPVTPVQPTGAIPQPGYAAPAPAPQQPYAPQPGYAPAPGAPAAPAQPSQNNEAAKAFGQWLLSALKSPATKFATQNWWSFVVTVVASLVQALLVYTWVAKAYSAATSTANSAINSIQSLLSGSSSSSSYIQSSAPSASVWFKAWIAFLILTYAVVLMTFVGRKILGDPSSFFEVHDEVAQRLIPFAALNVILILLSLVGGTIVAAFLFEITFLITVLLLPGALIAKGQTTRRADSYWLWLVSIVVCAVILFVAMILVGSIAGSVITDVLHI